MAAGNTNKEIAHLLQLGQRTVKSYLEAAFRVLEASSRAELAYGFAQWMEHAAVIDRAQTAALPVV